MLLGSNSMSQVVSTAAGWSTSPIRRSYDCHSPSSESSELAAAACMKGVPCPLWAHPFEGDCLCVDALVHLAHPPRAAKQPKGI